MIRVIPVLLVALWFALWATPVLADPFTAIATFVATALGSGAIATAIGAAVSFVARVAVSAALSKLTQGKQQQRQAQTLSLQLGETPRAALFGTACTAGTLMSAWNYGGKYGTDREVMVVAVADHLCDQLVGFYVNDTFQTFVGNGVQTGWSGDLKVYFQSGVLTQIPPSDILASSGANWTSQDRAGGVAHVFIDYGSNADIWTAGRPSLKFVLKGKRCYDPRKDTSVGGSGGQRWTDPTTWTWTDNAEVCRYNFERGIYAGDQVDQPAMLLVGRGLSEVEAPAADIFAAANLCDEDVPLKAGGSEKRYRTNGVIYADEPFDGVTEKFAAAMAGLVVQRSGAVRVEPGAAKSTVLELDDSRLPVGVAVTFEPFLPATRQINTIIPRYIEPAQAFQEHAAPVRRNTADIVADGAPHEEVLQLALVTSGTQAQRCGEIRRREGRLERSGGLSLPPSLYGVEEGDWIGWTSSRHPGGIRIVYRVESQVTDETWRTGLQLREIAASCYSWTAATDELTPGSADPAPAPAPGPLELDGVFLSIIGAGDLTGSVPKVTAIWTPPNDAAIAAVRLEIRELGEAEVSSTTQDRPNAGAMEATNGVVPGITLQGRLRPVPADPGRAVTPSAWVNLVSPGLVASEASSVDWTHVQDDAGTRPEDNATVGSEIGVDLHLPGGGLAGSVDVVTSEGTSRDTANVGGRPTAAVIVPVIDMAALGAKRAALTDLAAALAQRAQDIVQTEATTDQGMSLKAKVSRDVQVLTDALTGKASASDLTVLAAEIHDGTSGLGAMLTRLGVVEVAMPGKASASDLTALSATVTNPTTGLSATLTRLGIVEVAMPGKASASDLGVLAAEIHDGTTGLGATITRLGVVEAALPGKASAADLTTLSASVNNPTTGLSATLTRLGIVEAALPGKASASDFSTLNAAVTDGTYGLSATRTRVGAVEVALPGKASASDVTTLAATVGGHTSSITSLLSVTAGLGAKAGITLDVNGFITGWSLNNSGSSGDFVVVASSFKFVDVSGGTPIVPFEIVGGVVRIKDVEIDGAKIKNATIDTAKIGALQITTAKIDSTAVSKPYATSLATNTALPSTAGGRARYLSITITKDEAGSDVRLEFLMRPRPGASYACQFYVGETIGGTDYDLDNVWYWMPSVSISGLQSVRIPVAYFRSFSGVGTGSHTYYVDCVSFSAPSAGSFMEAGSSFEVTEVKRGR